MQVEIDDAQRAEILVALIDRKAAIAKHVKDLTKDSLGDVAAVAERRLALYTTQTGAGGRVGLVAMFSLAPDLDEERVKAGEVRDPEGQQDIFGGGAATGGGNPAGETGFCGAFGKLYPTQADADRSFRQGPEIVPDGPSDGAERDAAGFKALPPGEPVEDAHEVTIGEESESGDDRDELDAADRIADGEEDLAREAARADGGLDPIVDLDPVGTAEAWDQGADAHRAPVE